LGQSAQSPERHPAELLRWFKEADRDYGDGASYPKYLINIRKDAIAALSEQDRFVLGVWRTTPADWPLSN